VQQAVPPQRLVPSGQLNGALIFLAILKKGLLAETKTLLMKTAKMTRKIKLFILIKCLFINYKLNCSLLLNITSKQSFLMSRNNSKIGVYLRFQKTVSSLQIPLDKSAKEKKVSQWEFLTRAFTFDGVFSRYKRERESGKIFWKNFFPLINCL